ncbi:MAG: hypothetical protein HQL42_05370 [Alphaproteobacteria bacterium]|nr:hypothetical protein [Alphaproteobacteria bacterium]
MITRWRQSFALLLLCFAGCTPLVLESGTRHFAAGEYSQALADGRYAVNESTPRLASIVNRPDHVEFHFEPDDSGPVTLIGGFVALRTPGFFIFQATDAIENGTPVEKKPGEATTYVPVRVAPSGEVTWYIGPKGQCDAQCAGLLSTHGFKRDGADRWNAPKPLSREQILAFYEDLAPILERQPDDWEGVRMIRIAGS